MFAWALVKGKKIMASSVSTDRTIVNVHQSADWKTQRVLITLAKAAKRKGNHNGKRSEDEVQITSANVDSGVPRQR